MGAVIMFPRVRRGLRETQTLMADLRAAVVILPVIRIERACTDHPAPETRTTQSPPGRKRRKRAPPLFPPPQA